MVLYLKTLHIQTKSFRLTAFFTYNIPSIVTFFWKYLLVFPDISLSHFQASKPGRCPVLVLSLLLAQTTLFMLAEASCGDLLPSFLLGICYNQEGALAVRSFLSGILPCPYTVFNKNQKFSILNLYVNVNNKRGKFVTDAKKLLKMQQT